MSTSAPDQDTTDRLAELDVQVREAWTDYKDGLGKLDGTDYTDAEPESWDRLQETLRAIETDRARVNARVRESQGPTRRDP